MCIMESNQCCHNYITFKTASPGHLCVWKLMFNTQKTPFIDTQQRHILSYH